MPTLGPVELIIILVIVVVLFGASRLRGIGGALGGGIKEFKQAVRDEQNTPPTLPTTSVTTPTTADKTDKV